MPVRRGNAGDVSRFSASDALDWFRGLAADSSKLQVEGSRTVWEAEVRGPLERLLEELAEDLGGAARMFRPHRDVRFSKNKQPSAASS